MSVSGMGTHFYISPKDDFIDFLWLVIAPYLLRFTGGTYVILLIPRFDKRVEKEAGHFPHRKIDARPSPGRVVEVVKTRPLQK